MTDEQRQGKWTDEEQAERAIALQVLRDDHPEQWTRAELEAEIGDRDAQAITDALTRLEAEGVVILDGEHVRASACAWRMDALGLVSI
jgi:predicted transcriptional regulator